LRQPSSEMQMRVHKVLGWLYSSRIQFLDGAEAEIQEAEADDTHIVFVGTHTSMHDPFHLGGAMEREESLHWLRGRTFEPAKPILFKIPGVRQAIDSLDAVPAFRSKDAKTSDEKKLQLEATKSFLGVCVDKITNDGVMIIYPKGGREKKKRDQVEGFKGGTGRIACEASKQVNVALLPVAINYRRRFFKWRNADIVFGNLIHGPFENRQAVTKQSIQSLQYGLDRAIAMSKSK